MAADAILKIHFNGNNLVAVAHIKTKFGSETKNRHPGNRNSLHSNFTSVKIQDSGWPPFWKHINRHNSAVLWHYLNQMWYRGTPYIQITKSCHACAQHGVGLQQQCLTVVTVPTYNIGDTNWKMFAMGLESRPLDPCL